MFILLENLIKYNKIYKQTKPLRIANLKGCLLLLFQPPHFLKLTTSLSLWTLENEPRKRDFPSRRIRKCSRETQKL